MIRYTKTEEKELLVLNASEVEGYYRFPDLTAQTEYLCKVIETAVYHDLPDELIFLQNYDEARELMKQKVDMPDKLIDLQRHLELLSRGEKTAVLFLAGRSEMA